MVITGDAVLAGDGLGIGLGSSHAGRGYKHKYQISSSVYGSMGKYIDSYDHPNQHFYPLQPLLRRLKLVLRLKI